MYIYRLKEALSAIAHEDSHRMKIVTLQAGTIVRMHASVPKLPKSGLVDVEANDENVSLFMQDLKDRAERIQETALGILAD